MASTADFNHEDFQQSRQSEQDSTLLVKFSTRSVQDKDKSEESGRPVFREKEYIEITIPGSRDRKIRPATFRDRQRFPRHYAAYQQRTELPTEGTPLLEWGPISRTMADTLAFMNVKTVEDLASMSDTHASQMMGGQDYKQKAIAWLQRVSSDVTAVKLQVELQSRDQLIAELQVQINELRGSMDADKPKRSRKRSNESGSGGSGAGSSSGPVVE